MRNMRWFPQMASSVVLASLFVSACHGSSSSGGAKTAKAPVRAEVGTPKSLFVGNAASAAAGVVTASGVTTTATKRLIAVKQDDTLQPVVFTDQDGSPVDVEVTRVVSLSPAYVGIDMLVSDGAIGLAPWDPKTALVRLSDGMLFDITGMSLTGARILGEDLFAIGGADSPVLYDTDVSTLTSTMTSRAMNNPKYDPIYVRDSDPFDVDHALNARVAWDLGAREKILFHDNAPPVVDTWQAGSSHVPFCDFDTLAKVYGEDEQLYVVCVGYHWDSGLATYYRDYFVRQVSFTSSGTQVSDGTPVRKSVCTGTDPNVTCPESTLFPSIPYSVQDRSRYLPLTSGFFAMSAVPGGGIALSWMDKALPPVTIISGDYGYWASGGTISRIAFTADSVPETMVTAPNLIGWKVVGGSVVFTKYVTGTNIGTYRVTAPGATPELLLSEDMQIQQIVELTY